MPARLDLIHRYYAAFSARGLDAALGGVHADVDCPNAIGGGRVRGHEEVRRYWTRQCETIDPLVEPQAFSEDDQGRIVVDMHQVVRDLNSGVIADQHVYTISAGLISRMDIQQEPDQR